MADAIPFDWDALGPYKALTRFPDQYPHHTRTFFSPEDNVHGLLVSLLKAARSSIVLNMYGYDDDEIDALIVAHALAPRMYVQMSLDKSQAGGVHERKLLANVEGTPGTNVAIGNSTGHAISHLKVLIVDSLYVVSGSTNWSLSGEQKQDNQLTLQNDPIIAAEYRTILDRNHAAMLKQMAANAGAPSPSDLIP